ncbi:4-diphosphocytidyl-2C-methyl-D-erythritol synthase [Acrocarpospora corrugata]|uniref:4-diphosphocytidyl-2C-methyl-D-erythritol synthase n=1 Tax=Acrocarpospora corrugata TaxID=35763 RepID=A0A5M3VTJ2_9ACTN|nr:nucleotidyltransferase family protein [Acrocarpospora corrugata]GER98991.1 4-diphosphocytidyl-2C-methyl-D-erythritol synthase [Acrocarpospora corrugata]
MTDHHITDITGILLAAGAGRRLGTPKALVEFDGERLVDRGVRLLTEGGCHPVVVVLGAATTPVCGAVTVLNPDWETGMASSLRVGLTAMPESASAVVIALVDQPLIRPAAIERLTAAYRKGAAIAVATYGGKPRNPVLVAREYVAELSESLTGDAGARPFLRAHPELVTEVPCDDVGDPADIDEAADLTAIREAAHKRE